MNIIECYTARSSKSNAMQCCVCSNLISFHLRFTFVHRLSFQVSLWAEFLAQGCTRKQPWSVTGMLQKAAMDSKLTPNSSSICSRIGHGVDCLHQRSNGGQCMHTMTDLIYWRNWVSIQFGECNPCWGCPAWAMTQDQKGDLPRSKKATFTGIFWSALATLQSLSPTWHKC